MRTCGNLLPVKNQLSFEHRRQARLWGVAWFTVGFVLVALYGLLERDRGRLAGELTRAEQQVMPMRAAEHALKKLKAEGQTLKQLAREASALQQTDVPLALLQAVGSSCRDLGPEIQLDSLRMDEFVEPAANATQIPTQRKQLLIVGSAEADYLITTFVGRLNACGVFRKVELESSQASAEQQTTRRSFQIRCQQ